MKPALPTPGPQSGEADLGLLATNGKRTLLWFPQICFSDKKQRHMSSRGMRACLLTLPIPVPSHLLLPQPCPPVTPPLPDTRPRRAGTQHLLSAFGGSGLTGRAPKVVMSWK